MDESITFWLAQLKQGHSLAEQEIWERYFRQLVALARVRIREMQLREFDEEDVAISAFHSFFRAVKENRLPRLDDRLDLWKILLVITARKVSKQRRRQQAEKRGKGLIRGESVFQASNNPEDLAGISQALGDEPSPEIAVEVAETFGRLIDQLEDEQLQRIASLKMEGYTNREIAVSLDIVERTVERKLERIRERWAAHLHS